MEVEVEAEREALEEVGRWLPLPRPPERSMSLLLLLVPLRAKELLVVIVVVVMIRQARPLSRQLWSARRMRVL